MKKVSLAIKTLVVIFSLSTPLLASANEPLNTSSTSGSSSSWWWWWGRDDNSPSVPLDGGLSLLLAAGVGYGTKKVVASRKKSNKLS